MMNECELDYGGAGLTRQLAEFYMSTKIMNLQ